MKQTFVLFCAAAALVGCSPSGTDNSAPAINEPSGAQANTRSNTSAISEQHGWTGTNESGRSTNLGISPGGANSGNTSNP